MPMYTVKPGDYLVKIANEHGIANWKTIWDHPNNAELRKKRKSPDVLFPGDQVYVCDDDQWRSGRVVRLSDRNEAVEVPDADPRCTDVIWVTANGELRRYRYARVRPLPPRA